MLIFFCLATILIFPSAIGSPQTLPDDDYNPNPDTDSEEYDEENEDSKWKQPVKSKAQFRDQNQTVEVAEGSIARLHCRVENRDQGEQIMWYAIKPQNRQVENLLAMCGVSKDVNEGERKDPCIPVNSQKDKRMRFREDGQLLTISNVTKKEQGKPFKCSLALGEENPSIFLTLVVHPRGWEAPKTTPSQQPRSLDNIQNLPSTGSSPDTDSDNASQNNSNTASTIEKSALYRFISFALLASHLHFILPH